MLWRVVVVQNDVDIHAYGRVISQPLRRCCSEPADFGSEASFASDSAFDDDMAVVKQTRSVIWV